MRGGRRGFGGLKAEVATRSSGADGSRSTIWVSVWTPQGLSAENWVGCGQASERITPVLTNREVFLETVSGWAGMPGFIGPRAGF